MRCFFLALRVGRQDIAEPLPHVTQSVKLSADGIVGQPLAAHSVQVFAQQCDGPIHRDIAEFVTGKGGGPSEVRILHTDFDIDIKPYSLISVKGRALPPSAKLFYDLILQRARVLTPERTEG